MKSWKKPELKNLHLSQTKSGAACENMGGEKTLLPDAFPIPYCSYWKSIFDQRCTHPDYGKTGLFEAWAWPCTQYINDGSDGSDGLQS